MQRTNCLICTSNQLIEIINLGMHSFADTFIPQDGISDPDPLYPLICDLCENCGHVQARIVTSPSQRYTARDYSYTSANSDFSRSHWNSFSQKIGEKIPNHSFIVEIGSNDGYLSKQFLQQGHNAIGVDPSPYMAEVAKKEGVDTVVGLWSQEICENLLAQFGTANLVVANNVFNHAESPIDFINDVKNILSSNGKFVFEVPYWALEIQNGRYDQIYHEHVSYFTVRSIVELLHRTTMSLISVEMVDYHGGSLRVIVSHKEKSEFDAVELVENELSKHTFDANTYIAFMDNAIKARNNLINKVYDLKSNGKSIVAIGAAAKGNTFLSFHNFDMFSIDYVTDSSPHKQGKFTPKTRIPIAGDEIFRQYQDVYALILSWNISNRLKNKLAEIHNNIQYIM